MTVNIISDLHGLRSPSYMHGLTNKVADFPTGFDPSKLKDADVLVVAGDIGNTGDDMECVLNHIMTLKGTKFKDIICIKGNHDFYTTRIFFNSDIPDSLNVNNKNNNFVVYKDDIAFICTPLWSPVYDNTNSVMSCLADYYYIPKFEITTCNETFENNVKFLDSEIQRAIKNNKQIVIVTHHVPYEQLINEKYKGSRINEAFCVMHDSRWRPGFFNDVLDKYSMHIKLWIHGHSHNYIDTEINGIRFIRNPVGYGDSIHNECDWKYDCVVEV